MWKVKLAGQKSAPFEWEVCIDAVKEMREILDSLDEYSGVYDETAALRGQLERIEAACTKGGVEGGGGPPSPGLEGDPHAAAQRVIALLPLREIFQDKALADAFLSELMLSLARESSLESRRELQRKGIEEAKAQGVRFGKPARPLPENFEEAHHAFRSGKLSAKEAAGLCGMARTTFYNAVQRAEGSA